MLSLTPQAFTRILLRHDGSTTALLAGLLDEPLGVRVLLQAQRPAAAVLSPELQARMGLGADSSVVLRLSELIRGGRTPISSNKVVMDPAHPLVVELTTGPDIPIGYFLNNQRIEQRRELVDRGMRKLHWGYERDVPSVWRSYVIFAQGKPLMHIDEAFHPDVVAGVPELPLAAASSEQD
ncbi:chorismate--pyruvate lyase family protein [Planomonospora algeriensis]